MKLSVISQFTRTLDPVLFARDCGIEPDPVQARLLSSTSRQVLLNCTRQWGKSTTAALTATHEALYGEAMHGRKPMVILISPSQQQSGELFKKVHGFWEQTPGAPKAHQESLTRMELDNGARVVSLPGSEATTRGFSATLVVMDEAARVDNDLLAAVRPMLATTGGRFLALTTPKGRRGWFYEAWMHGEGWERVSVKASQCQRISPEYLAQEREALGPLLYSQEYECEFIDDQTSAFSSALIEQALRDDFDLF